MCYVHIFRVFLFAQPNGVSVEQVSVPRRTKIVFKYAESIKIPNNWERGDKKKN